MPVPPPAALPASHRTTIQPRTCPSIFPLAPAARRAGGGRGAGAPRGGYDHAAGRWERPGGSPARRARSRSGSRLPAEPAGLAASDGTVWLRSAPLLPRRRPGGPLRKAAPAAVRARRQAGTARRGWDGGRRYREASGGGTASRNCFPPSGKGEFRLAGAAGGLPPGGCRSPPRPTGIPARFSATTSGAEPRATRSPRLPSGRAVASAVAPSRLTASLLST